MSIRAALVGTENGIQVHANITAAEWVAQLSAEAADRHDEADNAEASLLIADVVTGGDAARTAFLAARWEVRA